MKILLFHLFIKFINKFSLTFNVNENKFTKNYLVKFTNKLKNYTNKLKKNSQTNKKSNSQTSTLIITNTSMVLTEF